MKLLNDQELMNIFRNISSFRKNLYQAPHKGILILFMLGRYWHCHSRLILFKEALPDLNKLIKLFAPSSAKSEAASYPFSFLRSSKIWETLGTEGLRIMSDNRPEFQKSKVSNTFRGGFIEPVYISLVHDKHLLLQIIHIVLDKFFPKALHLSILNAIGIPEMNKELTLGEHEIFKAEVMSNYEYKCVACNQLKNKLYDVKDIQVAHIMWSIAGGPDEANNGISLCSDHKQLFDHGLFTINNRDKKLIVSKQSIVGRDEDNLIDLHGKRIQEPIDVSLKLKPEYLKWHNDAVFK